MLFEEIGIAGAYVVDLQRHGDDRGFFARAYCGEEFAAHGLASSMPQINMSHSAHKGTIRGMHYQVAPHGEAKFVRCVRGAVLDVMIDLRPDSPTYLEWLGVELTAESRRAVYVPEYCAHGFQTLVDDTEVLYPVSSPYVPAAERGVRWDDPAFGIEWPLPESPTLSPKDAAWPDFAGAPRT